METLKQNRQRIISLTLAKRLIISLLVVLFFDFLLFPVPVMASQELTSFAINSDQILPEEISPEQLIFVNQLPDNNDWQAIKSKYLTVTAYNSEAAQTDNSPCITANGFDLCQYGIEDTVAANFLPFGTKIRLPELFGNKVFTVRDRMNPRYFYRVDIWLLDKQVAKEFGVKLAKIEILE